MATNPVVPVSELHPRQRIRFGTTSFRVIESRPSGRRNGWHLRLSGTGGHADIIMPTSATVELIEGKKK